MPTARQAAAPPSARSPGRGSLLFFVSLPLSSPARRCPRGPPRPPSPTLESGPFLFSSRKKKVVLGRLLPPRVQSPLSLRSLAPFRRVLSLRFPSAFLVTPPLQAGRPERLRVSSPSRRTAPGSSACVRKVGVSSPPRRFVPSPPTLIARLLISWPRLLISGAPTITSEPRLWSNRGSRHRRVLFPRVVVCGFCAVGRWGGGGGGGGEKKKAPRRGGVWGGAPRLNGFHGEDRKNTEGRGKQTPQPLDLRSDI